MDGRTGAAVTSLRPSLMKRVKVARLCKHACVDASSGLADAPSSSLLTAAHGSKKPREAPEEKNELLENVLESFDAAKPPPLHQPKRS